MDKRDPQIADASASVGYKRPPVEYQFKPGQKPPPRKKRAETPHTRTQLLVKILQEEQRVQMSGKARWCTKAELLLMVAFQLAEKGSPTVSRALLDYLMVDELPAADDETWVQLSPPGEPTRTYTLSGQEVLF